MRVERLWRAAFVRGPQPVGQQRTLEEPSDFEIFSLWLLHVRSKEFHVSRFGNSQWRVTLSAAGDSAKRPFGTWQPIPECA